MFTFGKILKSSPERSVHPSWSLDISRMLCSSGFNFTSWILDFVPALVTHAKWESSWRLHYALLPRSKSLPPGEGGARGEREPDRASIKKGPGEGRLVNTVAHSGPHPPLRGTLSRRERDSLQPLPTIANVQTPVSRREKDSPAGFPAYFGHDW